MWNTLQSSAKSKVACVPYTLLYPQLFCSQQSDSTRPMIRYASRTCMNSDTKDIGKNSQHLHVTAYVGPAWRGPQNPVGWDVPVLWCHYPECTALDTATPSWIPTSLDYTSQASNTVSPRSLPYPGTVQHILSDCLWFSFPPNLNSFYIFNGWQHSLCRAEQ